MRLNKLGRSAADDSFLTCRMRACKAWVPTMEPMEGWMNFLCRHVGHHRARSAIQFNSIDKRYESVCKRCRVKMVRTPDREWKVADELED